MGTKNANKLLNTGIQWIQKQNEHFFINILAKLDSFPTQNNDIKYHRFNIYWIFISLSVMVHFNEILSATLKTEVKGVLFLEILTPLCNRNSGPFADGLCRTTLGLTVAALSSL